MVSKMVLVLVLALLTVVEAAQLRGLVHRESRGESEEAVAAAASGCPFHAYNGYNVTGSAPSYKATFVDSASECCLVCGAHSLSCIGAYFDSTSYQCYLFNSAAVPLKVVSDPLATALAPPPTTPAPPTPEPTTPVPTTTQAPPTPIPETPIPSTTLVPTNPPVATKYVVILTLFFDEFNFKCNPHDLMADGYVAELDTCYNTGVWSPWSSYKFSMDLSERLYLTRYDDISSCPKGDGTAELAPIGCTGQGKTNQNTYNISLINVPLRPSTAGTKVTVYTFDQNKSPCGYYVPQPVAPLVGATKEAKQEQQQAGGHQLGQEPVLVQNFTTGSCLPYSWVKESPFASFTSSIEMILYEEYDVLIFKTYDTQDCTGTSVGGDLLEHRAITVRENCYQRFSGSMMYYFHFRWW